MAQLLVPNHFLSRFALSRASLCVAALGLFAGLGSACVISVHDGWGDDVEACYETYDDCLDDAFPFGADAIDACEALLEGCLESCERGETGEPEDAGDDSEDGDPPRNGDGDGDGPDPACFELHAACVDEATTIQEIEACEGLFDNCIDPGPCEDPECEEPGCPQEELDACVGDYADCAANALSAEEVLACEDMFDTCIAQFEVGLCLPGYDDELVLVCLEQHELCIACADDAGEIAACKTTFDNCLEA